MSKQPSIYPWQEEQRTALKIFLSGKDVFALFPAGFGKSLILTSDLTPVIS